MAISINSTKFLSIKDTIRLCPDMDTRQVAFKLYTHYLKIKGQGDIILTVWNNRNERINPNRRFSLSYV